MRKEKKKSPDMYKHSYSPAANAIFPQRTSGRDRIALPITKSQNISSSMTPLMLDPRLTFLHPRCLVTPENLVTFYQLSGAAGWDSTRSLTMRIQSLSELTSSPAKKTLTHLVEPWNMGIQQETSRRGSQIHVFARRPGPIS